MRTRVSQFTLVISITKSLSLPTNSIEYKNVKYMIVNHAIYKNDILECIPFWKLNTM